MEGQSIIYGGRTIRAEVGGGWGIIWPAPKLDIRIEVIGFRVFGLTLRINPDVGTRWFFRVVLMGFWITLEREIDDDTDIEGAGATDVEICHLCEAQDNDG